MQETKSISSYHMWLIIATLSTSSLPTEIFEIQKLVEKDYR